MRRVVFTAVAWAISFAVVVTASPAAAQKAPDAGTILRDYGGTGQPPAPPVLPPTEPTPPAPVPEAGGARILVKDFRIRATQFPEATLKALLKDYVGRELSLSDLREAAFTISEYYRQHDMLARAIVPRQTIRDGVVEIVVIEGKLGGVEVDPSSKSRLDPSLAAGLVEHRAPPGDILHPSRLQEGVAILNEVPGVAATATIRPGASEAETVADLKIADTPLVTGLVQADNQSAHYIGSRRVIGNVAVNDPFGRGEQVSALALRSQDSEYGRLAAQMPVGTSGLVLGLNVSYLDFALEGPFQALAQKGYASTFGSTAVYPIRRAPDFALSLVAGYDHKHIVDQALDVDIDNRHLDVGAIGLTATTFDSWLGGGANNFASRLSIGTLDRSSNDVDFAIDAATARTSGTFGKLYLSGTRLQRVVDDTDLYLSANGQLSSKNLDSSEKFSLGGPYGVRAYPINEANGDEGFLSTIELRHRLPYGFGLFGFYDIGGIVLNHYVWPGSQTTPGQPNEYVLMGAGVGVSWTPLSSVQIKGTYAHAIGDNPGVDASGNNADGQKSRRQFWVQGVVLF